MITYLIILLIASILPVVLIGNYIYARDYDREPSYLLKRLFWGGVGSCFIAAFLEAIVESYFPPVEQMNLYQLLIYVFVGIALIEEGCKLFITLKYAYHDQNFDYFYDGIVYAVFTSLGFACFENITYIFNYGISIAFSRGLLSVPGHACFGIFMGYFLSKSKYSASKKHYLASFVYKLLSLIIPVILHGIYDYCLFTNNTYFLIFFFIFIYLIYKLGLQKIDKFSRHPIRIHS